jgi:ABC-type transporter Mla maintaining outer membrane lipid asymmetry permease subunit MlaE
MVKAPLQFVSVKGVDPCWVVMLPRLWASSPSFQIAFVVAADLGVVVEGVLSLKSAPVGLSVFVSNMRLLVACPSHATWAVIPLPTAATQSRRIHAQAPKVLLALVGLVRYRQEPT